jgi:hypothetical protein
MVDEIFWPGVGTVEDTLRRQLDRARDNHSNALRSLDRSLETLAEAKADVSGDQRAVELWSRDIEQTSKLLATFARGDFNRNEPTCQSDGDKITCKSNGDAI